MPKTEKELQDALRGELSAFFKEMAEIAGEIKKKNPGLKQSQAMSKAWKTPGKKEKLREIRAKYPGVVLPRTEKTKKASDNRRKV